jgi:hypothetical protein
MGGYKTRASDDMSPEGVGKKIPKAGDDGDVEGHAGRHLKASDEVAPESVGKKIPKAGDDDDVEGHAGQKVR